jgi:hypothetical protein
VLWKTLYFAGCVLLVLFVLLSKTVQLLAALVGAVLEALSNWWARHASDAADTFVSSRHGKQLLVLIIVCLLTALVASSLSNSPEPVQARPTGEAPSAKSNVASGITTLPQLRVDP